MRTALGLIVILVATAALAPTAAAAGDSGFEFRCYDAAAVPGETVRTAVTLANESDRPFRYRVKARCRGDNQILLGKAGRVRGKWTKMRFTLQPGESRVEEMALRVPRTADGPLITEIKVRGPNGRQRDRESLFVHDPARGTASQEPVEVRGRIVRDDESIHPLCLRAMTGEEFRLVGSEVDELHERMIEQDLTEVDGVLLGYGMRNSPWRMRGHMLLDPEEKFLMLECHVDGIDDAESRIVPFLPVTVGSKSKITAQMTRVIQTEDDWLGLIETSGIEPAAGGSSGYSAGAPGVGVSGVGMPGMGMGMGMGTGGHMGMYMWPMMMGGWGSDGDAEHVSDGFCMPHDFFHHGTDRVDLDSQTLLCVFAGDQESEGSTVRIRGITREEDGRLLCHYTVLAPEKAQTPVRGMSQPYMIVAIQKTDAKIEFTTD